MGRVGRTFGVPEVPPEERARAVAEPGPSWREWFYFEFLKAWISLGFFVVDAWIATLFLEPLDAPAMAASLAGAVYLEFVAFRVLWTRPPADEGPRAPFRRTWLRPVRFGRWTPETFRLRAGLDPLPDAARGPDPREFL